MKKVKKSYKHVFVGFILFVLLCRYNFSIGMLSFCLFWQISAIIIMIKDAKVRSLAKKGTLVEAKLMEYRKIKGFEDEDNNYEAILEFLDSEDMPRTITHKFSSLEKPVPGKKYTVSINPMNKPNYVVMEEYGLAWKIKLVIFTFFILALCYVDVVLVSKI